MKKLLAFTVLFLMTLIVAGCSGNTAQVSGSSSGTGQLLEPTQTAQAATNQHKTLVVYFSHTGNTRTVAEQVKNKLNADILEIKPAVPYTTVYNDLTQQIKQELADGVKPKLQPINIDLQAYDTVVIASPIWWGTIALPIQSFLSENNLAGKTVLPILTHGGSGLARSVSDIAKLCPQADVKAGLAIRSSAVNSSQTDINQWLSSLGRN